MLADEQGLGKTITALAAARGSKRILVVAPTVVLWNWAAEAEKWLDNPVVQVISDGKADLDPLAEVVIVTHGLLLRPWILTQLMSDPWDVLIVDEAHAFKSVEAKRTGALYVSLAQSASKVWLLTGTPCPNNAGELYTHLRGLVPNQLRVGSKREVMEYMPFISKFCHWRHTPYGVKITGNRKDKLPELKALLDGFIMRRLTDAVMPDLPSIRFETVHLRPLKMDRALKTIESELSGKVREAIRDLDDPSGFFDTVKDKTEFAMFRRLCGMAKAGPVAELLHQELEEGGLSKVVVFAHHKDVVESIARALGRFGVRTITGATSAELRAQYVSEFQNDPKVRVMVANIVAGGVGITLTASADVVFAEQSWVPGENAQASKRCHRIGQTKPVRVRFIALAGTIDEDITKSNQLKIRMIQEVLND